MKLMLLVLLMLMETTQATTIYGADDRVSPNDHPDRTLYEMSRHVVVIKERSNWFFKNKYCSGFIISHLGKAYVLTAGHCIQNIQCKKLRFQTNFEEDGDKKREYKCDSIPHADLYPDLGIVRIKNKKDKDKTPIPGLPLNIVEPEVGDQLAVIGHPESKKMKISDNCFINRKVQDGFYHNCDTFHGNSGSITINLSKNYGISGILVAGMPDYIDGILNVRPESEIGQERSTDINALKKIVLEAINR